MEKIKEVAEAKTVPATVAKRRRYTFEILVFFLMIGFAVLTFFAKTIPYFYFDLPITKAIQNFHPAWFDFLMRSVTTLGNVYEGSLILITIAFLFAIFRKFPEAITLIISTVGVTILGIIFKTFVSRSRPDPTLILQIGTFGKSDSFPSGHVLYAIGLFGFLLFLVFTKFKKGLVRKILILLLVTFLILMGLSRIYLGAHWFSDTLGSYLIGAVWIYLIIYIFKKYLLRKFDMLKHFTDFIEKFH